VFLNTLPRVLVAGLGAGGALAFGVLPATAARQPALLPSIRVIMLPGPPLRGLGTAAAETLIPQGTTNTERVLVGIDATGEPVSVSVDQRLTLHRLGDYTFVVPGPIADVAPGRGTASEPGLRRDAVVWAGFSPGRKVLAARVKLRLRPAAAALPVRVRVADGRLVVENTTAGRGSAVRGRAGVKSAVAALDATRRTIKLGPGAQDAYAVYVSRPPTTNVERITAPLEVRGRVGRMTFTRRIGGEYPARFALRIPRGRLRLLVVPETPLQIVTPPGGAASWAEAIRRRPPRGNLLEFVSRVRLTAARAHQYQQFLANPDLFGSSRSVYVYETTSAKAAAPTVPENPGSDGSEAWVTVLITLSAVAGVGGLVVLWAHS